jgi:hypothetical protein
MITRGIKYSNIINIQNPHQSSPFSINQIKISQTRKQPLASLNAARLKIEQTNSYTFNQQRFEWLPPQQPCASQFGVGIYTQWMRHCDS